MGVIQWKLKMLIFWRERSGVEKDHLLWSQVPFDSYAKLSLSENLEGVLSASLGISILSRAVSVWAHRREQVTSVGEHAMSLWAMDMSE